MRKKLKKIRNLLAIALLIALSSCETEKLTESVSDYNQEKQHFKRVHLDEIPFIKKDILARKQNIQGRSIASVLEFINPENIIVLTNKEGFDSYTFALTFDEFDKLTNLVIQETPDGFDYELVKYFSTNLDLWKSEIENEQNPSVAANLEVEKLDASTTTPTTPVSTDRICINVEMVWTCSGTDQHHWGDDIQNCVGGWHLEAMTQFVACNSGGGISSNSGGILGLGNSSNGHGSITTPNIAQVTPCSELKKISTQDRDGIKQHIFNMRAQINSYQEHGVEFHQNFNGVFNNTVQPSTNSYTDPSIRFMAGGDTYGAIHTHPTGAFAIFTFADIYSFSTIYNNARASSKNQATLMLACKDRLGVKHVYALKVNDIIAFNAFINNAINAASLDPNVGPSLADRIEAIDEKFANKYQYNDLNNQEKAFLQFTNGAGISILEASDDLTNWSTLTLDSPTSPVNKTPCN